MELGGRAEKRESRYWSPTEMWVSSQGQMRPGPRLAVESSWGGRDARVGRRRQDTWSSVTPMARGVISEATSEDTGLQGHLMFLQLGRRIDCCPFCKPDRISAAEEIKPPMTPCNARSRALVPTACGTDPLWEGMHRIARPRDERQSCRVAERGEVSFLPPLA